MSFKNQATVRALVTKLQLAADFNSTGATGGGLDLAVYNTRPYRMPFNSKPEAVPRMLTPVQIGDSIMPEDGKMFEFWQASLITSVQGYQELTFPSKPVELQVAVAAVEEENDQHLASREGNSPPGPPQAVAAVLAKEYVQGIVRCLSADRAEKYDTWANIVGPVLKDLGEQYKGLWMEFGAKSAKFTRCESEHKWASFTAPRLVSFDSLENMARADDWRTYMALKASQRLTKACNTPGLTPGYISNWLQRPMTDWRFAELFDAAFPGQFKCVDAKSKEFYRFTNHRWVANASGDVSKLMSVHLHDALHEHARSLVDETVRKKAYHASLEFQCETRKDKIRRALVNLTGDPTFVERLDSKVNLLGFDNGVYDLDAAQFRGGRPEDGITFSVGYEYTPNVDISTRAEVLSFVHSIFGNAEVEEYVLLITASCLHGYRRFEEFYFHTGVGRNGKGALAELFAFVFGDYMGTMDTTFFTQPRKNSSGPQPELANKKGVRYLSAREAEDKEKIQVAKLNEITGGDPIETRGLFGKPFTYKPQFGIHFQFNALPKLSRSGQKASEERTRVVEYPNVFT